jgi:hypothetical protein
MTIPRVLKLSRQTLEQRGFAALKAAVTGSELQSLITQVDQAIRTADRTANEQQVRSLEPGCADAKTARQAAEDAVFESNRLATLLSRLQARHRQVIKQERRTAWRSGQYEPVRKQRDALAAELKTVVPECCAQLAELFGRVALNNTAIAALHHDRPDGMSERLQLAELCARNLDDFTVGKPSLLEQVQLFDFDTGQQVWPPPQPSLGATYAAMITPAYDGRYSADWHAANERRVAAIKAEQQRLADYYETAKQQQEERQNAEERQRFKTQQQRQP